MKKSRIKLVALLVAVALMLPNFTGAGALVENEVDDGLLLLKETEKQLNQQAAAMDEHKRIVDAWADMYGEKGYPDSFGGFYIDDNGILVVLLAEIRGSIVERTINSIIDKSAVRFETTDVTFDELINIQSSISELLPDLEIVESSISVRNSQVNVGIDANSASIINYTRNCSIPHVNIFPVSNSYVNTAATTSIKYNPGNLITNGNTGGTLGCYGKYSFGDDNEMYPCFVTAGHVVYMFKNANLPMYFGSEQVYNASYNSSHCEVVVGSGKISNTKPSGTSSGDYAFLEYNSANNKPLTGCTTIEPTSNVQIGITTEPIVDYFGQEYRNSAGGYDINKSDYECWSIPGNLLVIKGKGISGLSAGRVVETNWNYYCDFDSDGATDYFVKNMLKIETSKGYAQFAKSGDSGDAVLHGNTTGYTLLGIIQGTSLDGKFAGVTPLTILLTDGFVPYPWCDR